MNTCSMKTGPSITDAAMGRIAQTIKVISEGGYEKVFHQTFEKLPGEKLKKSYALIILFLTKLEIRLNGHITRYLGNNLLLGGILMEIGMLKNLTLDLHSNGLTGKIPPELVIGDVRGQGLMLGVELVTDRKEKMPTKAKTVVLFEKLKDLGVLLEKGGLQGNVFGIKP
ncbi:hypothetical protein ZIOFF_006278 [Zingiber officinale]|uniref:Uncharacterized protein n=1 Tax=Zingiber officinale TaxID=94328 RepID=A0A8J5LNF5_ZINOF|nr:hypothetical protein ZIOFF_006278 [Zingiber officinale]